MIFTIYFILVGPEGNRAQCQSSEDMNRSELNSLKRLSLKILLFFQFFLHERKQTHYIYRYVSTVAGLVICYLVSGVHTLHLILQILGNIIILKCVPVKKCHILSFIWCFSYLTLFRLSARLGLPEPPPHTNAIILILTLKMVGLAFEVHDSHREADAQNGVLLDPSVSDVFHYSLGHIGLITG